MTELKLALQGLRTGKWELDGLMGAMFVLRYVAAFAAGALFGVGKVEGGVNAVSFFILCVMGVPMLLRRIVGAAKYDAVTGEDPEAGAKVTAEAVAPALAAFLLLWVLTFNLM